MSAERNQNLILSMRTAQATDLILDKDATSNDDTLDAMTLAVKRINLNREEVQRYDFNVPLAQPK